MIRVLFLGTWCPGSSWARTGWRLRRLNNKMPTLIDIRMPDLQEGTESVVAAWLKKAGDPVKIHEPLIEINTDKAITEVASPATGTLAEILVQPDQPIAPGDLLGRIQADGADSAPLKESGPRPSRTASRQTTSDVPAATNLSPAVRALAKQHGVDLSKVRGTGRGGRITHEDVMAFLSSAPTRQERTVASGGSRRVPHSQMRRRIASHMVESMLRTAPHVTAVWDVDLSAIVEHRRNNLDGFQKQGARLTYTAYFVAASVMALQAVPEVNSRWHDDALEIFDDCNIGVATALESGLIVPVIRQAQKLDLLGIARILADQIDRARRSKIDLNEIQGGTFTITNHGVSGSLIATPIINQPQSAILGIGKMEKRAQIVEVDGKDSITIKPMAYVTLTIDHRALDGYQANRFLDVWTKTIAGWK
jgi:2-oxoglutarate dehydrogenase E2 component (dihydrolipoamide succinyltransferase)